MSFWYGLSFDDVANMPMARLENYLEKLPARFSELQMLLADVVSLPHMKDEHRRATMNGWMRTLQVVTPFKAKPASKARLQMMGIGVRITPVSKPTENE
jgi:hypothetical protein